MDFLIGILIILVPIIFEFIGRKMREAAQDAPPSHPVLDEQGSLDELNKTFRGHRVQTPTAQTDYECRDSVIENELASEPEDRKKGMIDPKKLIIYSEIMKPKYQE